jgi:hypothetical protein
MAVEDQLYGCEQSNPGGRNQFQGRSWDSVKETIGIRVVAPDVDHRIMASGPSAAALEQMRDLHVMNKTNASLNVIGMSIPAACCNRVSVKPRPSRTKSNQPKRRGAASRK